MFSLESHYFNKVSLNSLKLANGDFDQFLKSKILNQILSDFQSKSFESFLY